jgi:hypothetical protein
VYKRETTNQQGQLAPEEEVMALEKNLPSNLDRAALRWSDALRGYNDAVWHLTTAMSCIHFCNGERLPVRADATTEMALRLALKALQADLVGVEKQLASATALADAAAENSTKRRKS